MDSNPKGNIIKWIFLYIALINSIYSSFILMLYISYIYTVYVQIRYHIYFQTYKLILFSEINVFGLVWAACL